MEVFTGVVTALVLAGMARLLLVRKEVVPEGFTTLLYRHGRFMRVLRPGAHWLLRYGLDTQRVDLRQRLITIPGQEVRSQDQVGLKVSVAVRFAVVEPEQALHRVQNYVESLYLSVQLALREEVALHPLEELVAGRLAQGERLRERVAEEARQYGLAVETVEVKDVMLPAELRRAFAESLKSRKEAQAMLEKARGETAALRNLANAARMVEQHPGLLELRVLRTLDGASTTPGNTFVLGGGPELLPLTRRRRSPGGGPVPPPSEEESASD